jgi:XTP/dITP diphosphohydrolase
MEHDAPDPRRLVLATHNRHKLEEIERVLQNLGWSCQSLADLGVTDEPEEDGLTFEANARIKALAAWRATGLPSAADDSGLVVDALDGAPGVHSARFAGVTGDRAQVYAANNELLIKRLKDIAPAQRSARFVTELVVVFGPEATTLVTGHPRHFVEDGLHGVAFLGTLEGWIDADARGDKGFGYDPLFRVDGDARSLAEYEMEEKNAISHRGKAFRALHGFLSEFGTLGPDGAIP